MSDTTRDPNAPAQYMSGWYSGVSKEMDYEKIVLCFKQNDDLTNKLYDAMESFASGDHKKGDKLISETKPLFLAAVASCEKDILDRLYAINNKYDALTARSDWPTLSREIYMRYKSIIRQD